MSFSESLFRTGCWNSIPQDITNLTRQKLGENSFNDFTELCLKYDVFAQMFNAVCAGALVMNKNATIKDCMDYPLEHRILNLAVFLTNVGNSLCQQAAQDGIKLINDGIEFSKVALLLKPDHYPARSDLAIAYHILGRTQEAQSEAKRAILDMDKLKENNTMSYKDNHGLRSYLLEIAEGRIPEE